MASWCIDGVQADQRSANEDTAAMRRAVSLRQVLYTLSHYELHARRRAKSFQKKPRSQADDTLQYIDYDLEHMGHGRLHGNGKSVT
jgi:hypothetical protein